MAAAFACAAATGSALVPFTTARGDVGRLSSGNAFRTASLVQAAPVSSLSKSNRVGTARASLAEDSKAARREVLVSILAGGAALGFAGAALADPLADAKSKARAAFAGAKNAAPELPSLPSAPKLPSLPSTPELPSLPSAGGALGDVQKAAESAKKGAQGSIDGIFGKGKPGPFKFSGNKVASTNGGTGSALGDAQKRIGNFGSNPIPGNVEKYSNEFEDAALKAPVEPVGDQSGRVAEATSKVEAAGSNLQKKGSDAISEGKGFVGQARGSTPALPDLIPKSGGFELPKFSVPTPDAGKAFGGVTDSVKTKIGEVKGALPK